MQNFKVVLPQVFWVSIDPEVLRAHPQKSPFLLSCFDHFGEYSQKLLKNHKFENCRLKVVFETILQNGQNKIGKKVIFEHVPSIPLDRQIQFNSIQILASVEWPISQADYNGPKSQCMRIK